MSFKSLNLKVTHAHNYVVFCYYRLKFCLVDTFVLCTHFESKKKRLFFALYCHKACF